MTCTKAFSSASCVTWGVAHFVSPAYLLLQRQIVRRYSSVLCQTLLLFVPQMPTKAEVSVVIHEATLLLRYGMAWSLVGLAFSAIVPNPVIAMVSPFCIAQFMWLLSAVFGLPILNVKDSIFVLNGTELTPAMIWIQELVIVGVAITAFSIGVWKRSYSK